MLNILRLTYVVTALALFATSLSFSLPARAALPCKSGTINFDENGSIESCTLDNGVDISVDSFVFSCQQNSSIFFDKKAHFKSCVISAPIEIRTGNAVKTCPKESMVYVSVSNNGNQSISCEGGISVSQE